MTIKRLLWPALILAVAMTILSSHLRLSDAGLDCMPWPQCYGLSITVDQNPGISIDRGDEDRLLRVAHRIMASVFGLFALFLFTWALWFRSKGTPLKSATVILILTIMLALVGMNTPAWDRPIVTLLNLAGGMLLSLVIYNQICGPGKPTGFRPLMLTPLFLTVCTGAWVSANFAALGCPGLMQCPLFSTHELSAAFHPEKFLELPFHSISNQITSAQITAAHHFFGIASSVIIAGCLALRYQHRPVLSLIISISLVALIFSGLYEGQNRALTASIHNTITLLLMLSIVNWSSITPITTNTNSTSDNAAEEKS